ncbi:hypothetical protein [Bradyrhizobium sp. DASA03007]|uniref:hypothetical protein n=1 Tax=unclassified Bradyrhizobium TaxID=2631580 RepID=UPI003F7282B6
MTTTDEDTTRRLALLQALQRKRAPIQVTIENLVAAGDLVKEGLAEPIEIAKVLHVKLTA